ncbi:MAG: Ku protein, partial [Solirubrobacteraceae bacterium]
MTSAAARVSHRPPRRARPRSGLAQTGRPLYKDRMPRAIWSGAISFGLVNVPVKRYSATSPKSVRFHPLSAKTGARIKQKRVDPSTG